MKKIFATLLIVAGLVTASLVGATVKMYTATAEDYASEVESQDIAKLRARDKAIKKATKEAGVYLKTYSRSVNNELTDDEVLAITSNAWTLVSEPKFSRTVKQLSDETSVIVWTATVEVNVDDDEIQKWVKRDDKDKSTIITQTRESQRASEENERKVEDLRRRAEKTSSASEKAKLREEFSQVDREFLAQQKLKEGDKLRYVEDYNSAIKLYSEALQLNPNFFEAYSNRGITYYDLQQYEQAIRDFDKAIQLNPGNVYSYSWRSQACIELKQYERSLEGYDKLIELNPNEIRAYLYRGLCRYRCGKHKLAEQDFDKVINFDDVSESRAAAFLKVGNI